jgi:hypothetical protein
VRVYIVIKGEELIRIGVVIATVGVPPPPRPQEDVMTEPAAPYPYPMPYPDSATTGPEPSAYTAPPMPSEVTNDRRQRHSGGRMRVMMRRITRRP